MGTAKRAFWALVFGFVLPCCRIAAEPAVEIYTQSSTVSAAVPTLGGRVLPAHLHGSVSVGAGYDDNIETSSVAQGSGTIRTDANLSYGTLIGRAAVNLAGGFGLTYYLEPVGGRDTDTNAFAQASVTYPVSLRLQLDGNLSARYQTEPDFASDVGLDRRAGAFFDLSARIAARYRWSLRLSNVTSYDFRALSYDNPETAAFQERTENTLGQEWSFRLSLRSTLTAEYRLEIIDYATAPRDSITQFTLIGGSYRITSRLTARANGGASFRSYEDGPARTDPHFEGSLDYSLGPRGSLNWTGSYSIEESTFADSLSSTTYRTGLLFRYLLTWRITADIGVSYHHDENDSGSRDLPPAETSGISSSEDAFETSLSLHYVINRRFSLDAGYTHSEVMSDQQFRQYARNSYSLGLRMTF
jgi:hypothetical protein